MTVNTQTRHGLADLLRRSARIGFWFFLAKGLLWILVPAAAGLLAIQ